MALKAGLDLRTPCLNINKVCASGMKAVSLGATNIMAGLSDVVIAGGAESMSNAPHFVRARGGVKFGDAGLIDALTNDGLIDAYKKIAMGTCAEKTAAELKLSRAAQDAYAIGSYERTHAAQKAGVLDWEIEPVDAGKAGKITADEEPKKFDKDKMTKLKTAFPAFDKTAIPTVTSANASKLNDGACAFVLASNEVTQKLKLTALAEILAFADAEVEPADFNISPAAAVNKALALAHIKAEDVDFWEFNEAFSVTGLANIQILGIDPARVNVHGGAVALGHPIGMSGARIILSLINVMRVRQGKIGVAAICNGGGGSSAIVIKLVS